MSKSSILYGLCKNTPAVTLFLANVDYSDEVPCTLKGERPDLICSFNDLIPGWELYSSLQGLELETFSDCDLNGVFTNLLLDGQNAEKPANDDENLIGANDNDLAFAMGSGILMILRCIAVNSGTGASENKARAEKILKSFNLRESTPFNSPDAWHYYEYVLDMIKANENYNLFFSIFDGTSIHSLHSDGIEVSHEQNPEFYGYRIVDFQIKAGDYNKATSQIELGIMLTLEKYGNGFKQPFNINSFKW